MSTNDDKYLVLRGKNKDIYFIQKRISKDISNIIGKEFIKKSLETTDIVIARQKRDQILKELEEIASKASTDQENTSKIKHSEDEINVPMNKKPKITFLILFDFFNLIKPLLFGSIAWSHKTL